MVFITSMIAVMLVSQFGKAGVVYGFIIALSMEVVNLMMMTQVAKKAENFMKKKYSKLVDSFKGREQAYIEADASIKRSVEALEKQLQEYIDKMNDLEIILREKEGIIERNKDKIEKQQKIIAAATKPAWE